MSFNILTVVPEASLPAPGLPPSEIDSLGTDTNPARLTKANGYTSLEIGFDLTQVGTGDYALYRYWQASKSWKPEGPRGATPTTFTGGTIATMVPARVSVPVIEGDYCVVLMTAGGTGIAGGLVEVEEQNR